MSLYPDPRLYPDHRLAVSQPQEFRDKDFSQSLIQRARDTIMQNKKLSTCSIDPIITGFHKNMYVYIKIAPHCRLAIQCLEIYKKNAVKETQNNKVELQTHQDRKVHYTIG